MARAAVTYEQVAAIANALYAAGDRDPGTRAVREELAKRAGPGGITGSPNTIQRHLDQWRTKDKPLEAQEIPQLPPQVAADLQRALNAAASMAREKVEERLAQVMGELDELATTGEANETRIEQLTQELVTRTSERDSMQGQLTERTNEVDELKAALASTTEKLTRLETELHAAQTAAQEATGRVEEIRSSTDKQLESMRAEREQATHAKAEAEKDSVGTKVRLEAEREAKAAVEQRVAELVAAIARLEPEATRAAAASVEVAGLRRELERQDTTITMLQSLLNPNKVG